MYMLQLVFFFFLRVPAFLADIYFLNNHCKFSATLFVWLVPYLLHIL